MACMGIAAADFDGNGRRDLHITNFEDQWSNHYMQETAGSFVDTVVASELDVLSRKLLGFGVQAIDFDNNRSWDLVIGNGHVEDHTARGSEFRMHTQILGNTNNRFQERHVSTEEPYWERKHLSRALAKLDWNRDGRTDFIVTDLNENVSLLENRTESKNHFLQIELIGNESVIHFGLGDASRVDCITVQWQGGEPEVLSP